jgi:hypothetical protein
MSRTEYDNATIKMSGTRSTHCHMRRSPKKTKSTPARLAPLCFAPAHGASSAPACGARLPAAQPYQMLRAAALSWFWRAAACEPRRGCCRPCQVRNRLRVAMLGYQPCQAGCEAAASLPCRGATVGTLPPTNFACQRVSIIPSSKKMFALNLHVASICFKCFQRYVASVSYGCCKSRSKCCTCCNGCTRMLQAPVLNVSSVFLRMLQACISGCCIYFHTYDASVLSGCCVCLQWFQVFLRCFCKCLRHMFHLF